MRFTFRHADTPQSLEFERATLQEALRRLRTYLGKPRDRYTLRGDEVRDGAEVKGRLTWVEVKR